MGLQSLGFQGLNVPEEFRCFFLQLLFFSELLFAVISAW